MYSGFLRSDDEVAPVVWCLASSSGPPLLLASSQAVNVILSSRYALTTTDMQQKNEKQTLWRNKGRQVLISFWNAEMEPSYKGRIDSRLLSHRKDKKKPHEKIRFASKINHFVCLSGRRTRHPSIARPLNRYPTASLPLPPHRLST